MKTPILFALSLMLSLGLLAQESSREAVNKNKSTAVPSTIDFQGRLHDSGGSPVNATLNITFSIYTDAEGVTFNNLLWEETRSVVVMEGFFQVKLGEVVPINPDVFQYPDRWLALRVAGESEMSPRTKISSTGYAMQSIERDPSWNGNADPNGSIGRMGRVGIGINVPEFDLHVVGAPSTHNYGVITVEGIKESNYTGAEFCARVNGVLGSSFGSDINEDYIYGWRNEKPLKIYTSQTERMRITAGGLIGIGTPEPTQLLDLNGAIRLRAQLFDNNNTPGTTGQVLTRGSSGVVWQNAPSGSSQWTTVGNNIYYNLGNVGIGTTSPTASLQTKGMGTGEGNVLFEGEMKWENPGALPASGAGTRLMWYPDKAAFRSGMVMGDQWDQGNIGYASFAAGGNAVASGFLSTAIGNSVIASEENSVALGNTSQASGVNSTALGYATKAQGRGSTAMGYGTTAYSFCETVIGRYNTSYEPLATGNWNENDRLFVVGNGTSNLIDPSNALTILKNGNVGIGPSNPQYRLDIWAPTTSSTGIAVLRNSLGENKIVFRQNSNECGAMNLYHSGTTVGASFVGNGNSYFNGGNLGIGTNAPDTRLTIKTGGSSDVFKIVSETGNNLAKIRHASNNSGAFYLYDPSNINTVFLYGGGNSHITGGYLGIGTTSPAAGLHLKGTGAPGSFMYLESNAGQNAGFRIYEGATLKWEIFNVTGLGGLQIKNTLSHTVFFANQSGNVGIGTTTPVTRLDVRGNVTVRDSGTGNIAVQLGTGLDYAEGFNASGNSHLEPGTVLCIDPDHPGNLMMSARAYDTRVAGIVAGANQLGSGISLGAENHDLNVALAGRVYCNVEASEEPIQAGDLLTTSSIPGFAMKAADREKAQGAILGKAMESLEKGEKGMILVLVTLQ